MRSEPSTRGLKQEQFVFTGLHEPRGRDLNVPKQEETEHHACSRHHSHIQPIGDFVRMHVEVDAGKPLRS